MQQVVVRFFTKEKPGAMGSFVFLICIRQEQWFIHQFL